MAAYTLTLRNAHNAVQTALAGITDVLLTHEPGRARPYVVHMRHPRNPAQAQAFCFETDEEVAGFMLRLHAEATGEVFPEPPSPLVPWSPAPASEAPPKKPRRGAAARAAAAEAEAVSDD